MVINMSKKIDDGMENFIREMESVIKIIKRKH